MKIPFVLLASNLPRLSLPLFRIKHLLPNAHEVVLEALDKKYFLHGCSVLIYGSCAHNSSFTVVSKGDTPFLSWVHRAEVSTVTSHMSWPSTVQVPLLRAEAGQQAFLQEQEGLWFSTQVDLLVLSCWVLVGCLPFTTHMNFVLSGCFLCKHSLDVCPLFPQ